MPVIKISLTEEEFRELEALAAKENMSVQNDPPFTLPDIYGDAWFDLPPRMTGVFGKRFFNYVATVDFIQFAGMTPNHRRASYRITKQ